MSKLLSRLDQQISTASDPSLLAELRMRRACYLSRIGYLDASREIVTDVRKDFGAGENPRVSVLIMMAEGLLTYFESAATTNCDRLARAQLIAISIGDAELSALTSAWKAHLEYEKSDFHAMVASLRLAFKFAEPSNHQALARATSTISSVYFLLGDRGRGQIWFMKCRDHALADGDQGMLDAILYNRAAYGLGSLRCDLCFGLLDEATVDLVRLEVASTINYELLTQTIALKQLNVVSNARILLLQERYEEAIVEFEKVRTIGAFTEYNLTDAYITLEMSYCRMRLGQMSTALELYGDIANLDFEEMDIDDRLVAAWLRLQLCSMDERFGAVIEAKARLDVISEQYLRHRESLLSALEEFN